MPTSVHPTAEPAPPADLAAWRQGLRAELISRREATGREALDAWRRAIDAHLERGFPGLARGIVAFCWPYRGEYDARHTAARLRRRGALTALPVVARRGAPLEFREWHPGVALARGTLGIPYPERSSAVVPTAVLLPMVGFDQAGYRLGYGGGYFDRTLAALDPRPAVLGVAHELASIRTIYPQAHDIPVDYVVTERGIYRREPRGENSVLEFLGAPPGGEGSALSSPVCYAAEFDPPPQG